MKWQGRRQSTNVNRGGGGAPIAIGGGIGGLVIMLIVFLLGGNPLDVGGGSTNYQYAENSAENKQLEDFLAVSLADTEDVWHEVFKTYGITYHEPQLNLYSQATRSGCGVAQSNMGPFYCPVDQSVYIDVTFYNELKNRFGAGGDFAFAYVLAHEVGHHVQNELGIMEQVQSLRSRLGEKEYNKYSVALELQADYFAGLFAYHVREKGYLDPGDIEEALQAASAVGDDHIQEMSGRQINVDSFTHGSSKSRMEAFMNGFKYHDLEHSMATFQNLKYQPKMRAKAN